jgi:hypothetical protein
MVQAGNPKLGRTLIALCVVAVLTAVPASARGTGGTTVSPSTPVNGTDTMGTLALTSTTGTGSGTIQGRIGYTATIPQVPVLVDLMDASGRSIAETYARGNFTFRGLASGSYRMAVYALETGYVSQWYGGLPVQTHGVAESKLLEVGPDENFVDFVLEPGRSIQGRITWAGADRDSGWVWAYDASAHETGCAAGFTRYEPRYIIVGLVPGRYKIGATADDTQAGPRAWYGGAHSIAEASLADVTHTDATGIDIDLGLLPPTTTEIPPTTTVPALPSP